LPDLPGAFLERPLAHRGLHDRSRGIVENSRAAVAAAVSAGYGIEIDVQRARCGTAMVFHDARLDRLTEAAGPLARHAADALGAMRLRGTQETIPTLADILALIAGRTPVLIEMKDADEALSERAGTPTAGVVAALSGYSGAVAVMSFNPHAIAAIGGAAPDLPRGLTTCNFSGPDWPLPDYRRAELAGIADFERLGAAFVSHNHRELDSPAIARLRARGTPILCWTVRSSAEEIAARRVAHNITFEGYRPAARRH
jgi:glycerophosphoryl diester phosphodiesterase